MPMTPLRAKLLGLAALAVCVLPGTGQAAMQTFTFYRITNNNTNDVAGQFDVVVSDAPLPGGHATVGANELVFRFNNNGPTGSTIGEVYFDDNNGLIQSATNSIVTSAGASYQFGGSPGNLPAGNSITPNFNADFLFDNTGNNATGIDPGEWLEVRMTINSATPFADVVADLIDEDLRLGLHVRSIDPAGRSDSFVNNGPVTGAVPEPATLALVAAGAGGLLVRRFRRK